MVEVMAWFPVVEDFVAVLDRREGGSDEIGEGEYAEDAKGAKLRWCTRHTVHTLAS
jgi:hypothetical protein